MRGSRRTHALAALALGAAVAVGLPLLDLWRDCRARGSEACVWGRAYLPLTLSLGAAFGLVLAAVVYFGLRTRAGRRDS